MRAHTELSPNRIPDAFLGYMVDAVETRVSNGGAFDVLAASEWVRKIMADFVETARTLLSSGGALPPFARRHALRRWPGYTLVFKWENLNASVAFELVPQP
jgi:hypothetical protein